MGSEKGKQSERHRGKTKKEMRPDLMHIKPHKLLSAKKAVHIHPPS
jgi:hypothetical protein